MLRGSGGFLFSQTHVVRVTTPSASDVNKQCGCKCQPWFYLRLEAYSFFWLSEGAYSLSRDSRCSEHTLRLTRLWILTLEPERRKNRQVAARQESSEEKGSRPGAQAACCFRCSASKRTPFFHTSKVMAAILRAKVRRAIGGFMPLATQAL